MWSVPKVVTWRATRRNAPPSSSALNLGPPARRPVASVHEAGDTAFDVLIACAFNDEAHTKLGRILVLKAPMNADLHMAEDLRNTGKGNREAARKSERRGCLQTPDPPSRRRRRQRHSVLVHRYPLQRRELLRPPRLLPRRE